MASERIFRVDYAAMYEGGSIGGHVEGVECSNPESAMIEAAGAIVESGLPDGKADPEDRCDEPVVGVDLTLSWRTVEPTDEGTELRGRLDISADVVSALTRLYESFDGDDAAVGECLHEALKAAANNYATREASKNGL